MSTEYYIVAEKDDHLVIFDNLYKLRNMMLATVPNWNIDEVYDDYYDDILEGFTTDIEYEKDFQSLLRLLNFIVKYSGYKFSFFDDNSFIDYMYTKRSDWTWDNIEYYQPRY